MPETIITAEEFEAAGGDPRQIAKLAQKEAEHRAEQAKAPSLSDLGVPLRIGGREARSISAGVIALLERLRHPYFYFQPLDDDGTPIGPPPDSRGDFADLVAFLFVLVHPNVVDLVRWGNEGTLRENAEVWAFDIGEGELDTMEADAAALLDEIGRRMQALAGDDGGGKKKSDG